MGKRIYTNIEVRGVVYPDAQTCARALGVTPDAVRIAVRKGTAHRIGTGAVGVEPLPVRVRGKVYPSAKAAALDLGCTPPAVHRAIAEGREDRVMLPQVYNGGRSKPVRLGPLEFPSMAAADRCLGFGPGYVSMALRRGGARMIQRVIGAAMRESARRAKGGA